MERFVRRIVGGGVALVAGLWAVALPGERPLWAAGVALVLVGVAALADGVWRELDVGG
ncbi:hypothetical protein C474_04605 [Halogeometricum pallidum JCM 14848]|uniref:Uncharacterized protein n=1 Tax=Halogeometricum pallidum JCM 14848 TaxID=1227487 RepID=M0DCW5_HALPD|nr:hypothetical protein [Halogeometricum pallidum]ELZ33331.1 hypothetical protein C474_04605 [Halogeometricum pallidum JCM 14848]